MRLLMVMALVLCALGGVDAGQPTKTKTQEASGTAPVGSYTFPANFAAGRSVGVGMTMLGVEITRDQLTNPATKVELVVEISHDGGVSWPPDCLPGPALKCHDASQDAILPAQADWCAMGLSGGVFLDQQGQVTTVSDLECSWNRPSTTSTRYRGRLIVRGASATGTVSSTWR